jgi:hypothetical protein
MEKHLISRSEAVARIAQRANRSLENPDLTAKEQNEIAWLANAAQFTVFWEIESAQFYLDQFAERTTALIPHEETPAK